MNIQELIAMHNHPELAEKEGMVYEVWEDGEVTLTKSGPLLRQRGLHCIQPGRTEEAIPLEWLEPRWGGHAAIFTDRKGAEAIHEAILNQ